MNSKDRKRKRDHCGEFTWNMRDLTWWIHFSSSYERTTRPPLVVRKCTVQKCKYSWELRTMGHCSPHARDARRFVLSPATMVPKRRVLTQHLTRSAHYYRTGHWGLPIVSTCSADHTVNIRATYVTLILLTCAKIQEQIQQLKFSARYLKLALYKNWGGMWKRKYI